LRRTITIMRKILFITLSLVFSFGTFAQEDSAHIKELTNVVVTGQFRPQSAKNSLYQVRVVNHERIRLSGATTVQQALNNQLGFRFTNDNTLGTTNVSLMGMSGRNVKILLDGVPMVDRGDTRESLNQIDVNSIDRIEIVEGPMSVSYGSDALAGVINIITRRPTSNSINVNAAVQEETAANEYYPFSYKGNHMQTIHVGTAGKTWNFTAGGTHNEFDGFGGDQYGRDKSWRPKEQWLGNARIGYRDDKTDLYYRIDGLNEKISDRGPININTWQAVDKYYTTHRLMHQLQNDWKISGRMHLASIVSYTDYSRETKTLEHDFQTGKEQLTTNAGEQDISTFKSFVFRNTLNYEITKKLSVQPGIDINYEKASGDRIEGSPSITDYAAFVSAEWKPTNNINFRPGLRFIKNSAYDAPPAIPSINAKFKLTPTLDLRVAYAYGFRSPALRELYFSFHDANHDINGNPDLKAEHSNSFNGSINWTAMRNKNLKIGAVLSSFYNVFNNQIDLASQTINGNLVYSYFNVVRAKSAGTSLEAVLNFKNLEATIGFSYIGYYNSLYDDKTFAREDDRKFLWTPEVNSNITYRFTKLKTQVAAFYKFTGKKPAFAFGTNAGGQEVIYVANTSSFHIADVTVNTTINKYISIQAGVKDLFDVTNVTNTAQGSVHNAGGSLAVNYGRSYFLGLNFSWNKK
jgi:outer membrane receptor for ferrienterochelin and colicins